MPLPFAAGAIGTGLKLLMGLAPLVARFGSAVKTGIGAAKTAYAAGKAASAINTGTKAASAINTGTKAAKAASTASKAAKTASTASRVKKGAAAAGEAVKKAASSKGAKKALDTGKKAAKSIIPAVGMSYAVDRIARSLPSGSENVPPEALGEFMNGATGQFLDKGLVDILGEFLGDNEKGKKRVLKSIIDSLPIEQIPEVLSAGGGGGGGVPPIPPGAVMAGAGEDPEEENRRKLAFERDMRNLLRREREKDWKQQRKFEKERLEEIAERLREHYRKPVSQWAKERLTEGAARLAQFAGDSWNTYNSNLARAMMQSASSMVSPEQARVFGNPLMPGTALYAGGVRAGGQVGKLAGDQIASFMMNWSNAIAEEFNKQRMLRLQLESGRPVTGQMMDSYGRMGRRQAMSYKL